mmetsp:Transcript_23799/g.67307  ORF Transcript_23799/g.67307 Transcript_23799/m.67307 type:complete len:224 (-) Transcript_23799:508-1179(-)
MPRAFALLRASLFALAPAPEFAPTMPPPSSPFCELLPVDPSHSETVAGHRGSLMSFSMLLLMLLLPAVTCCVPWPAAPRDRPSCIFLGVGGLRRSEGADAQLFRAGGWFAGRSAPSLSWSLSTPLFMRMPMPMLPVLDAGFDFDFDFAVIFVFFLMRPFLGPLIPMTWPSAFLRLIANGSAGSSSLSLASTLGRQKRRRLLTNQCLSCFIVMPVSSMICVFSS